MSSSDFAGSDAACSSDDVDIGVAHALGVNVEVSSEKPSFALTQLRKAYLDDEELFELLSLGPSSSSGVTAPPPRSARAPQPRRARMVTPPPWGVARAPRVIGGLWITL